LACKDEDGKLISEQKRILERWEQCFRTLMKTDKKLIKGKKHQRQMKIYYLPQLRDRHHNNQVKIEKSSRNR
jgi:hypothetical protein